MNNEEKIYHKIKEAAHKDSENSFPGMEKVWNRVEEKLNISQTKKKSEIWKKLSIAASFLLFFMVGFFLLQNQKQIEKPIEQKIINEFEKEDSTISISKDSSIQKSSSAEKNNQKSTVTKQEIVFPKSITIMHDKVSVVYEKVETKEILEEEAPKISADVEFISRAEAINRGYMNTASARNPDFLNNRKIYDAVSVNSNYKIVPKAEMVEEISSETKNDDLVIIDGKPSKKTKDEVNFDNYEITLELKNPLYIINGEEYSEESLFGEKPTSKYAPLNKQKIKEIKVIEPEEAKITYGEKGSNGVVIITIKK